ncbi:hypothetical protein [Nonomuraea typhae]|uniref:hypothetical protein n=1 Tax=Nonomuraea typhae TaxID=2603600 RepID=UPI0012FCB352|nr:hypothetical protein [Nonomuraea typhae]
MMAEGRLGEAAVVDETEGSPFERIRRIANSAANGWALGPNGPYEQPGMTMADIAFIRIDEQRLNTMRMHRPWRDEDRG